MSGWTGVGDKGRFLASIAATNAVPVIVSNLVDRHICTSPEKGP
jgi:hypothetical protein